MYSKSSILARLGWSPTNFDRLLGEPDERRPNSGRPEMCFYAGEKVIAAEGSPLFLEIAQSYRLDTYNAPSGLLLKDNPFAEVIHEMPIGIVAFTLGRIQQGAIGHYNAWREKDFLTRSSEPSLLRRAMVTYAMDVLAIYDRAIEERAQAVANENAVRAIRFSVLTAISKSYPTLSLECHEKLDALNRKNT